jgi:TonB family protein
MRTVRCNAPLRWSIATGVLIVHAAVLALLMTLRTDFPRAVRSQPETPVVTCFVVEETRVRDTVPIPEVTLQSPPVVVSALQMIKFEADDWGDISGVVAAASAPQLSRLQPVDATVFARNAGLALGQPATVVLIVEVLADGRVGTVEVARGSGDPSVDAAAVAYSRHLRWTPGTRDHQAETMRVTLPVTLVWNSA